MEPNLFDLSEEYDRMLHRGIRLSGEDKAFFLKGRVLDLADRLPASFVPHRILDFGCGIGDSAQFLAETFPAAEVVGVDTAAQALEYAAKQHGSQRVSFQLVRDLSRQGLFDLCYINGVFHHIAPPERAGAVERLFEAIQPGGYLALFENNPWNPGTRLVMRRIPFDRDAQTLTPYETRRLLQTGGFQCERTRYLFYFPRPLAFLRFMEPSLASVPLGAQYYVLAKK